MTRAKGIVGIWPRQPVTALRAGNDYAGRLAE
jgi:hypothetical protein